MANLITGMRILCGLALLWFPPFSPAFYALYLTAGVTDMADGAVARITHTVSAPGALLDSAADFVLVVVCMIKLIPVMEIPAWILAWAGLTALIRAANAVTGCVIQRKPVFLHTAANRAAGFLLFLLPLTVPVIHLQYSAAAVCIVSTFAAVQEGYFIRRQRVC